MFASLGGRALRPKSREAGRARARLARGDDVAAAIWLRRGVHEQADRTAATRLRATACHQLRVAPRIVINWACINNSYLFLDPVGSDHHAWHFRAGVYISSAPRAPARRRDCWEVCISPLAPSPTHFRKPPLPTPGERALVVAAARNHTAATRSCPLFLFLPFIFFSFGGLFTWESAIELEFELSCPLTSISDMEFENVWHVLRSSHDLSANCHFQPRKPNYHTRTPSRQHAARISMFRFHGHGGAKRLSAATASAAASIRAVELIAARSTGSPAPSGQRWPVRMHRGGGKRGGGRCVVRGPSPSPNSPSRTSPSDGPSSDGLPRLKPAWTSTYDRSGQV